MPKPLPHQKFKFGQTVPREEAERRAKNQESVEAFLARGGTITKLDAPWDGGTRPDRHKKPVRSTWGNWGSYGE